MDVENEDCVHEDTPEGGPKDEELPPVDVRPRPSKEGVNDRWDGLQDAIVALQLGDVLLHPDLLIVVMEVEVGADLIVQAKVDTADLRRNQLY